MPRKRFSAERVALDIARAAADDRTSPPTREVSLSDVVRALWPNIQARRAAGQPFPRIADWLTTLGYEVSAATLCVYWHRISKENPVAHVGEDPRPPPARAVPATTHSPALPAEPLAATQVMAGPTPTSPTRPKLPRQIA